MKSFVLLLAFLGVAFAQNFNGYNYDKPTIAFLLPSQFQQHQFQQQLRLQQEQRLQQQQLPIYGPPQRFSAPQNEYGPPPPTELTPPEVPEVESREDVLTTTEMPTTTEMSTEETTITEEMPKEMPKESEEIKEDSENKEEVEEVDDGNKEEGVYYIYHPSGLLQRIVYTTNNDVRNMAYTAQFRYKDIEPIRDPIYTYDPETLVLKQILA